MFKKTLIISIISVFIIPSGIIAQDIKIGYVDKVKVLTDLGSWQNADKKLLIMKEDAEFELQRMLAEADSLSGVLQNQMMLTETMRTQLQTKLEQISRDYQRTGISRQQEILKMENDLKAPILAGFNEIIRKLGIDEDYTFIYDNSVNSILFASGGRDVTEQVLFEMRKNFE